MKSYRDYIVTGEMDQQTAAVAEATRGIARFTATKMLAPAANGAPVDTVAFGMLDVVAVKLVEWYGAEAGAEVFDHYAKICRGRVGK